MPASLFWLALGAFAIGTEGFMISGVLPSIATDLRVSVATAGQLVTVFAIAYALGSPLLAAWSGALQRRRVLIGALAVFSAANGLAALAPDFPSLAMARILLALAAGLYLPSASAVAASVVTPERRARALAVITGGGTLAVALGVPIGTWVSAGRNWRITFAGVGVLATLATLGLIHGLPANLPRSASTLRERLRVIHRPAVLNALLISCLWAAGGFSFYTYIAPFLETSTGFASRGTGFVLSLIGVSAAIGTALGGWATDRYGAPRILRICATLLIAVLAALSFEARGLPQAGAMPAIVITAACWAAAGWGFGPAQATRLISLAPDAAPMALSLHASAVYLGIATGSALGGLTVETLGVTAVGWTGALCQLAGLILIARALRSPAVTIAPSIECPLEA